MVRTNAIRGLGGFDESMRACEDWDMWRRLSWNHRIEFLDEVLLSIRRHGDGTMQSHGLLRHELRHLIKMTFDTPRHLRHMVARAWVDKFWREAANVYAYFNAITNGRSQRTYRFLRHLVRRGSA